MPWTGIGIRDLPFLEVGGFALGDAETSALSEGGS